MLTVYIFSHRTQGSFTTHSNNLSNNNGQSTTEYSTYSSRVDLLTWKTNSYTVLYNTRHVQQIHAKEIRRNPDIENSLPYYWETRTATVFYVYSYWPALLEETTTAERYVWPLDVISVPKFELGTGSLDVLVLQVQHNITLDNKATTSLHTKAILQYYCSDCRRIYFLRERPTPTRSKDLSFAVRSWNVHVCPALTKVLVFISSVGWICRVMVKQGRDSEPGIQSLPSRTWPR